MLLGTSLSIKNCEMFHRINFVNCQQTVLVRMCTLKKSLEESYEMISLHFIKSALNEFEGAARLPQ